MRSLIEYSLEILQSSALGQISQACVLQGSGLGGFSNDRSVECIHVPAAKFLPLQRRERLGEILLVRTRRVAPIRASVSAGETGRTVWPIDHQNLCSWVTAVAFGCGLCGASRQVEQAVEGFVGLDCRDLWGGRLAGHRMPHPPLKPRPTGALAPARNRAGRCHGSRPILGRRLPQEDTTDACAKVRRPADGERVDVEWSLLKPSGVVGDKHERAETDLAALSQTSAWNHDDGDRKNCNFSNKSLRHLPHGGRQLSWI